MRQHSRKGEEFTWRNIDLMEGAPGEITPTNTGPAAVMKPTGRGKVIRILSEDDSGNISYPCDISSQVYRDLEVLAQLDQEAENVVGVGLYKDVGTGVTVIYKNMFILDLPPRPMGSLEGGVATVLFAYESKETKGDTTVPVVGS